MVDYELVETHLDALKKSFVYIGSQAGYSEDDLMKIRDDHVNAHGKTGHDWKKDPVLKLALDYAYCVEQEQRYEDKLFLSDKIRLRLYWMASKNKHIRKLWDEQLPDYNPENFLQEQELADELARQKAYSFKGKRRRK